MTLLELLSLLRKHIVLVIALPVIAALIAAAYSTFVLPQVYSAETSVYALNRTANNNNDADGVSYQELQSSQLLANDFAELAKNNQVRRNVADALGLNSLAGYDVSVTSSTTTRVIKVRVTGPDPELAAKIANQLAGEVGETAVRVMGIEAISVITEAETPSSPSGPPRKLYTLAALLAGLFVAIAIVVLRDMLDTAIHTDTDLEELTGIAVLGRFPLAKGGKN